MAPISSQALDSAFTPELTFRGLYAQYLPYVWHSLRRLGMPERDLPDLTQEAFIVAFRRRGEYDPARPLKPWLFGIAFRVASDFRRTARNTREVPAEQPASPTAVEPGPRPDEALDQAQKRALVQRALDRLDFDRRTVMVMHELQGHSVPEISEALGIPLNTAYSRLRLARADFGDAVRRERTRQGAAP